ncbi:hypothetical protein EB796_003433 [Bugula neritina]|uniref:Torsin-1A-interacting protein 1/2 AAA+ activator domain-containing protein n=1 Tax=Bugula neritina TaxID=10212 RepID=A0A7J7KHW4_BUGNE|nr:hypothetical protein EB796_003433 [Bugula neritina]
MLLECGLIGVVLIVYTAVHSLGSQSMQPLHERYGMWILLAALILVCAFAYPFMRADKVACGAFGNPPSEIRPTLEKSLPPQSKKFWNTLKATLRQMSRTERPSCVVLAADSSSVYDEDNMIDAVEKISNAMSCVSCSSQHSLVLKGGDFVADKQGLDERLSHWFSGGNRVAVIHNIDKLNVDTAKLFYKVCEDNPDPQFPHTILFLTVTQNPGDEIDQYWLGKVLRDHWSDEEDVIGPLLSRIGNYMGIEYNFSTQQLLDCLNAQELPGSDTFNVYRRWGPPRLPA